jgi:hypothetical protein
MRLISGVKNWGYSSRGADSGIVRQFLVDMGGQGDGRAQRRPALVLPAEKSYQKAMSFWHDISRLLTLRDRLNFPLRLLKTNMV